MSYWYDQLIGVVCGLCVKVSEYVKFPTKFSSDSLQICYIDSVYHTHQYVHGLKLIYFIICCIFRCFIIVFTEKNVAWEKC